MSTLYFGDQNTILDRGTIEAGVLSHVQNWMVPYLARIEVQAELPSRTIATPKSWKIQDQMAGRRPEDTLPAVVVISTGTDPGVAPYRDGDGFVCANWLIAIGAIVSASTQDDAKALAGYYGAAIRGIMMQMPALGGYTLADGITVVPEQAFSVQWRAESYDELPQVQERMMSAVRMVFSVEYHGVINVFDSFRKFDGTLQVPADPYSAVNPYPMVENHNIVFSLETK